MIESNIYFVAIGWIIRWLFYAYETRKRVKKQRKVFRPLFFIADNFILLVLSFITSMVLYQSLPSLFNSMKCEPCNNHVVYVLAGYCNFDTVKFIVKLLKKRGNEISD